MPSPNPASGDAASHASGSATRVVLVLMADAFTADATAAGLQAELRRKDRDDLQVVNSDTSDAPSVKGVAVVVTDYSDEMAVALWTHYLPDAGGVVISRVDAGGGQEHLPIGFVTVPAEGGLAGAVDALLQLLPKPVETPPATEQASLSADEFSRRVDELTPRRRALLLLLTSGVPDADIAKRLEISQRTVRNMKYELLQDLGVRSQTLLLRLAIRAGIVQP